MSKVNTSKKIFSVFIVLVLASLACTINLGGPKYPGDRVPVTPGNVDNLTDQLKNAFDSGAPEFTLTVTENQLTELIAKRLASEPDAIITDPQVYLNNGEIRVYGKARSGNFTATALIVVQATVDESGKPKIEITSANFGPLPLPEGIRDSVAGIIQESLTGTLVPAATGIRLKTIAVANGVMTVTGTLK